LHCQPTANGIEFVSGVKCTDLGFENGCKLPDSQSDIHTQEDMCINSCGVRGKKLQGKYCGQDTIDIELGCAAFICEGLKLVPDHKHCFAPGTQCDVSADCASCNCINHQCVGNFVKHCPDSSGHLQCP
jgi:hypothetical protein